MILKEFKFIRFKGEKNEWSIEGKPDGSGIAKTTCVYVQTLLMI